MFETFNMKNLYESFSSKQPLLVRLFRKEGTFRLLIFAGNIIYRTKSHTDTEDNKQTEVIYDISELDVRSSFRAVDTMETIDTKLTEVYSAAATGMKGSP